MSVHIRISRHLFSVSHHILVPIDYMEHKVKQNPNFYILMEHFGVFLLLCDVDVFVFNVVPHQTPYLFPFT